MTRLIPRRGDNGSSKVRYQYSGTLLYPAAPLRPGTQAPCVGGSVPASSLVACQLAQLAATSARQQSTHPARLLASCGSTRKGELSASTTARTSTTTSTVLLRECRNGARDQRECSILVHVAPRLLPQRWRCRPREKRAWAMSPLTIATLSKRNMQTPCSALMSFSSAPSLFLPCLSA